MSYTPEQQAAAWAAYYAQQGYDPAAPIASSSTGYNNYSSAGPSNSNHNNYDPELAQQSLAYVPQDPNVIASGSGGVTGTIGGPNGTGATANGHYGPDGKWITVKKVAQGKRETVIRKKGGVTWEDKTLLEWDPSWFRLFVGDLSNDVSENTLNNAFTKYPSFQKSKVVRDRLSMKAKYGFIAFKDPEDFLKAWKEMDGKYVGNRPIRLMKCDDSHFGGTKAVTVGARKAKELDKLSRNKGRPLNGRPTAW